MCPWCGRWGIGETNNLQKYLYHCKYSNCEKTTKIWNALEKCYRANIINLNPVTK